MARFWRNGRPFRFILVCRHWYGVAISIPSLWSHIYFNGYYSPPLTVEHCPPPAPLHLNTDLWEHDGRHVTWWDTHCARLVSFHIRKARIYPSQSNHLLEVTKRPAPLLESLCVEDMEVYKSGAPSHPALELKQFRHLKRLTLCCDHLTRPELEEISTLTNLTHLFLKKILRTDIFHVLPGFSNSSFLEVLILEASYSGPATIDLSDAPIVCLPVLRHLETHHIRQLDFLDHLDIPSTTTIVSTLASINEAPMPDARLEPVQTLDVKFSPDTTMNLCFLSDTSVMIESDRRRNLLFPLLSTWFPNVTALDLRLLHHSDDDDSEARLMGGIIGWIGLKRLIFNETVDYFRLIDILDISGTWSVDPQFNDFKHEELEAPVCPILEEVVVWEVPADLESKYEGIKGRWKYREPGRYEIERPIPALTYTLVVRAQTLREIPYRPSFRWTETDRY